MQNSDIYLSKKVIFPLLLIIFILLLGTSGYTIIEGWNIFNSFYMTVITISTVGFQEIEPLSEKGKVFTIGFIFLSLGVVGYAVNNGVRIIFEGEIQEVFGRRKLKKAIESLKDHYIICGYGRMGRVICNEFKTKGVPFVVIEKEYQELDEDDESLITYGDATRDELLKRVGIERAKGLISVLDSDAQNLYVVLSAKGLNNNLFIVSRASEEGADHKLMRAGAHKVVSPYHIGGLRIAHTILKPTVVDFLELTAKRGSVQIQIEEVFIEEGSLLADNTIREADNRSKLGVIIVTLKRKDGKIVFNPAADTKLVAGDVVAVIGEPDHFNKLEKLARGRNAFDS